MATKRPACIGFGPFLVVQLSNGVSLDFHERDGNIFSQHYAFLIGEDDFDQVFDRLRERGLQYWADPGRHRVSEINRRDGGRGMYFEDPDGHLLEVITSALRQRRVDERRHVRLLGQLVLVSMSK